MNKKKQYQIFLIILTIILLINLFLIFNTFIQQPDNVYKISTVGSNENGTVYKIVAGNLSSDNTIDIILGVHPRENEIHEEINKTIYNICYENGTQNLTNKYIIYYISVNDNLTSHEETRVAGENLASQFIVPNITNDNPILALDVHEINPYYKYANFIFTTSNKTDDVNSYMNSIINDLGINEYKFTEGTSPQKVTKPIANQGINTFLMEVDITSDISKKHEIAKKLIECLDKLKA